jgi:hypothetical protein
VTKATQAFELLGNARKLALTPALSPGERGNGWQRLWNRRPLGGGAVLELIGGFYVRPHPGPLPPAFALSYGSAGQERRKATKATQAFELSGSARNLSLSPGERAGPSPRRSGFGRAGGVRASVALTFPRIPHALRSSLPLTFRGADYSGASISGQWVRGPLLQRFENRVADSLALAPQLRVPETQFLDSKSLEEPGSFCVIGLSSRMAVLEPVEFNREPRLLAEKVEKVFSGGMLASKFVAGEPPVPQPPPHEFLGPGGLLPERTGEAGVGHGGEPRSPARDFKKGTGDRAHSQERGNAARATQAFEISGTGQRLALTPALSPGERGKRLQRLWNKTPLFGGGTVFGLISGFYARPHPGPLPPAFAMSYGSAGRERGNGSQPSWKTTPLGGGAVFERRPTNATSATQAFELSGTARNLSLSPGERAGVRASVPLALLGVHYTLRASVPLAFLHANDPDRFH